MLIGILSDIHDNLQNLEKALAELSRRQIRTLIFCGDFCSPIPARVLGAFRGEVHCVFGNGDGDPLTISRIAAERTNLKLHGPHAELSLGSARRGSRSPTIRSRAEPWPGRVTTGTNSAEILTL